MAIAVFVNGAKGHAALHLSRDLNVQYKTAFVLSHKLREAMGSQVHNPDQPELSGTVEIDGMYAGGNVKPANKKTDRVDRRLAEEQTAQAPGRGCCARNHGPHLAVHRAAGERRSAAGSSTRRVWHGGSCRRIERLGAATRILRYATSQSLRRICQRGRRKREPG